MRPSICYLLCAACERLYCKNGGSCSLSVKTLLPFLTLGVKTSKLFRENTSAVCPGGVKTRSGHCVDLGVVLTSLPAAPHVAAAVSFARSLALFGLCPWQLGLGLSSLLEEREVIARGLPPVRLEQQLVALVWCWTQGYILCPGFWVAPG